MNHPTKPAPGKKPVNDDATDQPPTEVEGIAATVKASANAVKDKPGSEGGTAG